jgi:hypothetical protein
MTINTYTREIGPLSVRADIVPGTLNEEARTVEVVWTTGARVKRYSWFDGPWYEELSTDPKHVRMARLESGRAPVLLQHNSWNPDAHQGVIERATIAKGEGRATLRFLKDDEDADKTWNKIRQGVLTSVSVGYDVHKMEKIEGGDETIPVYRAVDWEPYEISPVSMPADIGAHARSAPERRTVCEIITRGAEPQKEQHVKDKETTAPTSETARKKETEPVVDADALVKSERERIATITELARTHGLEKLADEHTRAGTTVDAFRKVVLDKLAERSEATGPGETPSGAIEAGTTEREKRLRGMTGWLIERAGLGDVFEQARQHKRLGHRFKDVSTDGGQFRGLTLLELARDCLERSGVNTRGMDKMQLVGRAFTQRGGGMQTTSDFAVLFEDAVHKMVLAAYATTPDTWRRFCRTDTVPDFRESKRYRSGALGVLDDVNEHGEFKNKAIPDGSVTSIQTGTKGNIIALTRQAIINDDLGALRDISTRAGRAGALTIESAVYALLAQNSGLGPTLDDGKTFFHADHGNINSTGSALGVVGLDADRVVMGLQRDPSGNEVLELRPYVLLVPLGLGGEARVINDMQYEDTTSKFQKPNKVRGLFRDIVDTARLSGTRRYLFANPMDVAAFTVVFLEGQGEAPMVESQDGWRVDGTEWKVRLDVSAQPFDPKGAVTNAGA